jgi:DNA-binding GntR family transcriptional regulator
VSASLDDATLAQRAYARLEEMIVVGELAPGEIVSEQRISKALGIGRTPVREALHRLAANEMVRISPRRGSIVGAIGPEQRRVLFEARHPLERLLARFAARHASPEQRRRFLAGAAELVAVARGGDNKAVIAVDGELKRLLVEAARNPLLAAAVSPVHSLSRRLYFTAVARPAVSAAAAHAAVYRAIARGQEERAVARVDAVMAVLGPLMGIEPGEAGASSPASSPRAARAAVKRGRSAALTRGATTNTAT